MVCSGGGVIKFADSHLGSSLRPGDRGKALGRYVLGGTLVKVYAIAALASIAISSEVFADIGENPCTFGLIKITNSFIDDISGAPLGAEIGEVNFDITVDSCEIVGPGSVGGFFLAAQPTSNLSGWCNTTADSIQISSGGLSSCTTSSANIGLVGPSLGFWELNGSSYPKQFVGRLTYRKFDQIPVGATQLSLQDPRLQFGFGHNGTYTGLVSDVATFPQGEVVGTKCSLSSSLIPVDFGPISNSGASKEFEIAFSDCGSREDATAFNNAVSVEFRSENIREDGTALLNCSNSDCAKGIQIGLKDSRGRSVNLLSGFKLSDNSPVITDSEVTHTFTAEVESRVDEAVAAGKIDTQLVFETIVE